MIRSARRAVLVVWMALVFSIPSEGSDNIISWIIAGGGGTSAGNSFVLFGTIGDAASGEALTGGGYNVEGGFVSADGLLIHPSVTAIAPASGPPGTMAATISGSGLGGATAVTFSGTGVTAAIVAGGTATSLPISITIDADAARTARTVTVVSGSASSAPFSAFTVTDIISTLTPVINALAANPSGLSQAVAPHYGGMLTLTIAGTDFDIGAVASIGSTNLATTRINSAQLTAQVPPSVLTTVGTQSIQVTNPGGLASNSINFKTVIRGDINANGSINIGDALVTALTVGGINRPPLPVSVGDVNLSGSVNIGDALVIALFSGRLNANLDVPKIVSISPSPAVPGDALTLTGTGFSPAVAGNQVLFTTAGNSVRRITPSAADATSLTVAVPADAISGPIQVYRVDMPLGGAEYPLPVSGSPAPVALTSISPSYQVTVGTTATITGMGFDPVPSNNSVVFKSAAGTVGATVTTASATSLTVTVPTGAVCGPVKVTTEGQTSNARMVAIAGTSCGVQLADIWGGGSPGEVVVLEGAGFEVSNNAGTNNIVTFATQAGGSVTAPVLAAGGHHLHVRIPDTAVAGNVTVTAAGTTSDAFAYSPPTPTIPSSIDVSVDTTVAIGAYQLTIAFDKNIVTVNSANVKGGTGAGFTGLPSTVNIDNSAGIITINHFQVGNSPTGVFTVANIAFTPVAVGTTNLTVSGKVLTGTGGDTLPDTSLTISNSTLQVLRAP